MSNFKFSARHKESGQIHEVWAADDYYGRHRYGYCPNIEGGFFMTENEFYSNYETEEVK